MNNQQDPFSGNQNSYDPSQANSGSYGNDDQRYSPQGQAEPTSGQQFAPPSHQDYPTQQYDQQQGYPPQGGDYPTQQYASQNYPPQGGYDDTSNQYQSYPPQGGDYPGQQYGQGYPNQAGYSPSETYPSASQIQEDKKPVYKQPWFFIVIGLIVALIIGGIVLALTMGGDKKATDKPTPTKTESTNKTKDPTDDPSPTSSTEEPAPDPDPAEDNGGEGELSALKLSVVDTNISPTKAKSAFSDEQVDSKAGEFVWVKVALKNTGNEPITVLASDFKAQVAGKTFKPDSDIIEDPDGELSKLVFEVNPGTTEEGWVLFDLPSGEKDKQIYVKDLFGDSSTAKVKF